MTIEEAIKHCDDVAEKQRSKAHMYDDMMVYNQTIKHNSEAEYYEELMNECYRCVEEYRQFAEWLRELNKLRDFANFVAKSVMEEDFDENSDFYAEAFCRKLYKMGFVEISDDKWILNNEEVNTDDTNRCEN